MVAHVAEEWGWRVGDDHVQLPVDRHLHDDVVGLLLRASARGIEARA